MLQDGKTAWTSGTFYIKTSELPTKQQEIVRKCQVLYARRLAREYGSKVKYGTLCWYACKQLLSNKGQDHMVCSIVQYIKSRAVETILDQLKVQGNHKTIGHDLDELI